MNRVQVRSNGGGVQSAAIAALIVSGRIKPPDIALIVDTEREASTTWDYLDSVIKPALDSVGLTMRRVKKSDFATVDLYSSNGDILIPAFTDTNGGIGKLPTFCSNEWKQRVMRRWAASLFDASCFDVWLGISTDEMRRIRQIDGRWRNRYPLIEQRMNRGDCIALVARMGWPEPPRSSCWMCPNRSPAEWEYQRLNAPSDHEKAIAFEREIRLADDSLWLTCEGVPLDHIERKKSLDLFSGSGRCDSGYCFT